MAGTTTASKRTQYTGSDVNDLIVQFNKLVTDVETLRANYATGTGVTATAAAALLAAKIGDSTGTAITA